ncbi:hypothetical protein TRVL_00202 [Trypanosoma vivax]|nr:hypothetical protein TRVL_00202 [Trypanosoma vivax]
MAMRGAGTSSVHAVPGVILTKRRPPNTTSLETSPSSPEDADKKVRSCERSEAVIFEQFPNITDGPGSPFATIALHASPTFSLTIQFTVLYYYEPLIHLIVPRLASYYFVSMSLFTLLYFILSCTTLPCHNNTKKNFNSLSLKISSSVFCFLLLCFRIHAHISSLYVK